MGRKIVLTDEQIKARKEKKREYQKEWSKANHARIYAKLKERMADDPEYEAKIKARWAENRKRRRESGAAYCESPEAREKRLRREREYRARKARERKLANPVEPKEKSKPKIKKEPKLKKRVINAEVKRKPGRLLALMGWNGY